MSPMFCKSLSPNPLLVISRRYKNESLTAYSFTDSHVTSSQNGARIKTNFNTTGFVANITYSNIQVSNISIYGIDIQQDYLNGGPTGIPSNGVIVENIVFNNITGTMDSQIGSTQNYFVLCGDGSCSNVSFSGVNITGGETPSSCNFPPEGCPGGIGVNGTKVGKREAV